MDPKTLPDSVCAYCKYWEAPSDKDPFGETLGECRRKPPHVFLITDEKAEIVVATQWPETAPTGWCGEFVAGEGDEASRSKLGIRVRSKR